MQAGTRSHTRTPPRATAGSLTEVVRQTLHLLLGKVASVDCVQGVMRVVPRVGGMKRVRRRRAGRMRILLEVRGGVAPRCETPLQIQEACRSRHMSLRGRSPGVSRCRAVGSLEGEVCTLLLRPQRRRRQRGAGGSAPHRPQQSAVVSLVVLQVARRRSHREIVAGHRRRGAEALRRS